MKKKRQNKKKKRKKEKEDTKRSKGKLLENNIKTLNYKSWL